MPTTLSLLLSLGGRHRRLLTLIFIMLNAASVWVSEKSRKRRSINNHALLHGSHHRYIHTGLALSSPANGAERISFSPAKMPHRIMFMNKTAPRKLQRSCLAEKTCCRFCHPTKPRDHLQLTCARLYSIEDTCALFIHCTTAPALSILACVRRRRICEVRIVGFYGKSVLLEISDAQI